MTEDCKPKKEEGGGREHKEKLELGKKKGVNKTRPQLQHWWLFRTAHIQRET
jgi:hypothetical protein